jgi:hypothetical protein
VARLTILAKGNADLRDCLIGRREGDTVGWNGLNDVLRAQHRGWRAHVRHETFARSDAMLAGDGVVPASLVGTPLPLAAHSAQSQFATRLFDTACDAISLSIQPDVMNGLARHRGDGHLLHPDGADGWDAPDRERLARDYRGVPPLEPDRSMANFATIIARLRERGDRPILIFNMSPIVPWERVHNHQGLAEGLAYRITRFNLALVDLSRRTGISIVDVDAVLARAGASRLKVDAVRLTSAGCALVAGEVVRILADLGCLSARQAAA